MNRSNNLLSNTEVLGLDRATGNHCVVSHTNYYFYFTLWGSQYA